MATDAGPSREGLTIHTSVRCSECHDKMRGEWKQSAHANAFKAPAYQRARRDVGADAATCDGCHAPLARWLGIDDPASREGVTCDVCHNISAVTMTPERGRLQLAVYDMVKYGPLCDAEEHYFHRMGCSPLHREAELCGGCHQLVLERAGTALPVLTTYADWKAGPYSEDGVPCQSCHMPGISAEVAEGSGTRAGVPDHRFVGGERPLRQRALELRAELESTDAGGLRLEVTLRNSKAGHFVPGGLPARRLVVSATLRDSTGIVVNRQSQRLGRVLADKNGAEVPFYRATQVVRDTRIGPRASRTVNFGIPDLGAGAGSVEIEVFWRAYSDKIAAAMQLDTVEQQKMTGATLKFGARSPTGSARAPRRKGLPAQLVVKP